MKIMEALKKTDRTLLEMHLGQLLFGAVCQAVGVFFAESQGRYAASLWMGIAFAAAAVRHMAGTLDRALRQEADASKLVLRGYVFRYAMLVLVLVISAQTRALNPLVVFLGYMSMKVAAYMQPFTHKILKRLFREEAASSDPDGQ